LQLDTVIEYSAQPYRIDCMVWRRNVWARRDHIGECPGRSYLATVYCGQFNRSMISV